MVAFKVQTKLIERKFEEEHKSLELEKLDLQKKLEGIMQELAVAKSTLTARNSELAALQNNLKELDELREMKEVITCTRFFVFGMLFWVLNVIACMHVQLCLQNFRTLIERMSKPLQS